MDEPVIIILNALHERFGGGQFATIVHEVPTLTLKALKSALEPLSSFDAVVLTSACNKELDRRSLFTSPCAADAAAIHDLTRYAPFQSEAAEGVDATIGRASA